VGASDREPGLETTQLLYLRVAFDELGDVLVVGPKNVRGEKVIAVLLTLKGAKNPPLTRPAAGHRPDHVHAKLARDRFGLEKKLSKSALEGFFLAFLNAADDLNTYGLRIHRLHFARA
jgi:hypothetical protein